MQWLEKIVDEVLSRHPDGEIVVSSGVSPSGTYHLGTLREVLTAEAVAREVRRRGRQSRHVHVVDDLDVFRKVPVGVPETHSKYLGMPLCDVPAPDGSDMSYADYYLKDLLDAAKELRLDVEIMRAHEKYREGYFIPVIEKTLVNIDTIRKILAEVSGRELNEQWSPVQIVEDGYLKNRQFVSVDTDAKEIVYKDKDGNDATKKYDSGEVKLSWRIDWPARWSLLSVNVEPFGRDHATKGGSYDTGKRIVEEVFEGEAPLPIPYNFINKSGETKKMSKSAGDTITAAELLTVLPAEIVWYFILRFAPDKQLFFDEGPTLVRLVDEYAVLQAKPDKTDQEKHLLELCNEQIEHQTVSNVPFSHLVASYQASLKDTDKTIEVIERTEHGETAKDQKEIIVRELTFIDNWLKNWAPEDVVFNLVDTLPTDLSDQQKNFLAQLAALVEGAPEDADGNWFHQTIYDLKDKVGMEPKEMFSTLYQVLIGKNAGPRAGWFLSILPRDWLIKRLKLEA